MRNIKSILLNLTSKHVLLMLWWCVVSWVVFSPPHPTPHPLAARVSSWGCVGLPGCGQPTTNRGRGGPDLPPLGADLSIPALGGFLVVGWWLSGQGAFSPLSHVPDLRTPPVFLIQVLILEFFVWHLLLEMFMGRGNSCLSPGDFCSHQQSTSRESAGSGQEPKSQVNYPHHFFASLLPPSIFYWIQTLHPGGRFGLFSIQLFFHYSGFNLGFNLLYCPLFGTVGVGGVYAAM